MSWITPKEAGEPLQMGEGITRTSEPGTQLFPVRIEFPQGQPMTCTVRARDSRQALRFAMARHPSADFSRCRVIGPLEARAIG